MRTTFFSLLTLLIISGCSTLTDLIAEKDKEAKIEGKRVAILKSSNDLKDDASLAGTNVILPPEEYSLAWLSSNIGQYLYADNIKLPPLTKSSSLHLKSARRPNYLYNVPVITENALFLINGKGEIVSYQLENLHKPVWVKNTQPLDEKEEYTGGGITYDGSKLYVTAGHKDVVALSPETGKEIWRHSLHNLVRSAPIIYYDKLFVVTIDNKLYALDNQTGGLLWMHEGASESIGMFGSASIAVSNGIAVTPHSSGQLHGINIDNGEQLWSVNLAFNKSSLSGFTLNDIDITPIIRNGVVYVAGNMGSLYAIDLLSGYPIWEKDIKGIKSFWIAGDFLFLLTNNNNLAAILTKTGQIKWSQQLQKYIDNNPKKSSINLAGPIIASNKIILTSDHGKLIMLSPENGEILEEHNIEKNISTPPVIVNEKLYLLANDGILTIWH